MSWVAVAEDSEENEDQIQVDDLMDDLGAIKH
jgi:hypothetical protein